jgi:hypothetical protein
MKEQKEKFAFGFDSVMGFISKWLLIIFVIAFLFNHVILNLNSEQTQEFNKKINELIITEQGKLSAIDKKMAELSLVDKVNFTEIRNKLISINTNLEILINKKPDKKNEKR